MITKKQIKEWEEIEKEATKGPWLDGFGNTKLTESDLRFIDMARAAFPLLIKENRQLRDHIAALLNQKLARLEEENIKLRRGRQ